mgnify:CR=1 FL=1
MGLVLRVAHGLLGLTVLVWVGILAASVPHLAEGEIGALLLGFSRNPMILSSGPLSMSPNSEGSSTRVRAMVASLLISSSADGVCLSAAAASRSLRSEVW